MNEFLLKIAERENFPLPILQNPDIKDRFIVQKLRNRKNPHIAKSSRKKVLQEFKRQLGESQSGAPVPLTSYVRGDPIKDSFLLDLALGGTQINRLHSPAWDLPNMSENEDLDIFASSIASCEKEEIRERKLTANGPKSDRLLYKEIFQLFHISRLLALHEEALREEACPLLQWKMARMPPWIPIKVFRMLIEKLHEFLKELIELSIDYMEASAGPNTRYFTEAAVRAACADLGIDRLGTQYPHILEKFPDEPNELTLKDYKLTEVGTVTPLQDLKSLLK